MAWRRLPTFSFSGAVSSWVMMVAGPAMLAALVMLEIDRTFEGVFFNAGEGGAPIYYQHLSWIFFTGCYLVFLLPAFGAISEILPVFSGKPPALAQRCARIDGGDRPARSARLDAEHVLGLDSDRVALPGDGRGSASRDSDRSRVRHTGSGPSPGGDQDACPDGVALAAISTLSLDS